MTKPNDRRPSVNGDSELLGALALLRERRAPYAELLAGIVAETLERFPPAHAPSGSPADDSFIVEIGAGVGQLRQWLPATLRAAWGDRLVHTDPSEPALRLLRERAPQAKTRIAAAETLPFDDGSCGGVLGLCVFDAISSDEAAVVAELGRVLGPGGRECSAFKEPFQGASCTTPITIVMSTGRPSRDR